VQLSTQKNLRFSWETALSPSPCQGGGDLLYKRGFLPHIRLSLTLLFLFLFLLGLLDVLSAFSPHCLSLLKTGV